MPTLIPISFYGAKSSLLKDLVADYEGLEASGIRQDITLRGNDISPTGSAPGAVIASAPGIQSYSGSLSSQFSQYLSRASTADLQCGGGKSFTFEAWIFSASAIDGPILSKFNGSTNEFYLFSSGGNTIMRVFTDAGAGNYDAAIANPSAQNWHQLIGWFDAAGATVNLQIDGGAVTTVATVGNIVNGNSPFYVGSYPTAVLFWNGRAFPVRKWDRVLTVTERATLYNGGAGMVYPFESYPAALNPRRFAGFPVLLRLASGVFKLYWNNGENHSLDNAIIRQESSADFSTWTHGPNLEADENLAVVSAIQLASTNVLRFTQRGIAPAVITEVFTSSDAGSSWNNGATVTNPLTSWIAPYGRPYQLAGGDILLPVYGENIGESTRSLILKSSDGGATWTLHGTIAYDGTGTLDYNETSIINTGGTNWFAIIRTDAGIVNQNFFTATSVDDGATWSVLTDAGFPGNSPELAYDGSGNLFLFYRDRAGLRTVYRKSADNGSTWGAMTAIYTDVTNDCAYPSAVYNGGIFYVSYYRTVGLSVNVWSKAAAAM